MSNNKGEDVEKGLSEEENQNLLGARNEGSKDDGEHPNRADFMELAEFKKPDLNSSKIAASDVKVEEPKSLEETNISEGTNESEECKDELQKLWDKNTSLLDAIATHNNTDVMSLLKNGANPNATFRIRLTSACHIAAFSNEEALRILLDAGAERRRFDRMGITPLHYAAWTNAPKKIAMILDFPEALTNEVAKVNRILTPEQEAEIREIGASLNSLVDGTTTVLFPFSFDPALPDEWMTNVGVREFGSYPRLEPGCSALHAASEAAHPQCVRLLLAAGADPNIRGNSNSTPLDVAGASSSDDNEQSYVETLQLLCEYRGSLSRVDSLVLERALRKRSLQALTLLLDAGAPINHRNLSGYTPMHLCVEFMLKEHLEVLANHSSPEMDYRAVDVTDEEGSTVLHWAAREGWSDGITVALLARADITHKNAAGDTALHLAAKAGDYDIVKQILDHDTNRECDFSNENVKGESPFSNAIYSGNARIVKLMLDLNNDMRNYLHRNVGNLTPLEYAVEKKFENLFLLILNEQNELLDTYETIRNIVNVIAKHNLCELFSNLENINCTDYLMNEIISMNYTLHEANKHSSREMIIVLLEKGADLSQRNEDGQTAISLLMYHVTKPTEFMTKVLDECIKTDKNIYDKDCVITINYSVLMPVNEYEENYVYSDPLKAKDMKVLEALLETGDVYDQMSLLIHPVVESFLFLKWKSCAKFIYFLISAYVLFLISLNTFIATIYYDIDHKNKAQDILFVFYPTFWRYLALFTLCLFSLMDLFFWTSSKRKWYRNKTIWVKLLLTIGGAIMICIPMEAADNDIIRGVAVITVSLSWIYLMIYLSWTPTLGYYMQMYGIVSKNVIKVMLSFSFPLVGFSLCFMILLHSREPFDDPIAAFFKTMVMMSSEFEYENLVKNTTPDSPKDANNSTLDSLEVKPITSVFMLRIFFLLFFICVAIVLMNLMLGVAVSDLQELSHDGKQRRLKKQVECISVLEKLFEQRPFSKFKFTKMITKKIPSKVEVKPDSKMFSREMKETILNKAQSLIETEEKKADDVGMKEKIDDMLYDLSNKQSDLEKELSEIKKSINTILEVVAQKDVDLSEKTISKAVDRILEGIAKDRRADRLGSEQTKLKYFST